ncbi:MAG: HPr(Ser) kinase/phosphatase [Kiritimatiellia bacterium]
MKNSVRNGKHSVTVEGFLTAGVRGLEMELVAGKAGLKKRITEAALNRPGLALSGFFKYFAHKRVQVLGLAEYAYLNSLDEEERERKFRAFFEKNVPCVVMARGKKIFPELPGLADEFKVSVLRSRMITKHFINAATILMENIMAPQSLIQGTMVEIMGVGVLIEGRPQIGKSETALSLIKNGHALISDDVTRIRLDSAGALIGAPAESTRYHMEIRGLGIIHVPSLFGVVSVREAKKLDLVATLCGADELADRKCSAEGPGERMILGVSVPQVTIPVVPGRDLANVLETAALDQKLKRLGHDAAKELDERLINMLTGSKNASE